MKLLRSTISILLLLLVAIVQTTSSAAAPALRLSDHKSNHVRRRLEDNSTATIAGPEGEFEAGPEGEFEYESEGESETESEGPSLYQIAQQFLLNTYNATVSGLSGVARIVSIFANIASSIGSIGSALGGGGD